MFILYVVYVFRLTVAQQRLRVEQHYVFVGITCRHNGFHRYQLHGDGSHQRHDLLPHGGGDQCCRLVWCAERRICDAGDHTWSTDDTEFRWRQWCHYAYACSTTERNP